MINMNISPINTLFYISPSSNYSKAITKPKQNITFSGLNLPFYLPHFINKPLNQNSENVFFVHMNNYDNNQQWAKKMLILSQITAKSIRQKASFEEIVSSLEDGVKRINQNNSFGELRHAPGGFYILENQPQRGIEYFEKYKKAMINLNKYSIKPKSNSQYPNANTCNIIVFDNEFSKDGIEISYGIHRNSSNEPLYGKISNLQFVKEEYDKLIQTKNPSLKQINKACATIQWLIAQETPWKRGSDSIAKLLITSIYSAYNVKISSPKEGVNFDFEAFYTNLDDYIKKYPNLFSKKPYKTTVNK